MTPPPHDTAEQVARAHEAARMGRLAAADGPDDGTVRELYAEYGPRVFGLGVRMLGDRGAAEDLVQETFVRLWRDAAGFDPAKGSLRTFLFVIARRTAVDLYRRRSARPLALTGDDANADAQPDETRRGERAFDQVLESMEVREALDSLSDAHREVLELHYDADLTQRQIAERLGIPLGTVKSRTRHGLLALRTKLNAEDVLH